MDLAPPTLVPLEPCHLLECKTLIHILNRRAHKHISTLRHRRLITANRSEKPWIPKPLESSDMIYAMTLTSFPCARTPLQAELQTQHCTDASRAACRRGGARVSQHAHHLSTGLGVGRWPAATGPFAPATVTAPRNDPSRVSREPADRPFPPFQSKR